MGKLINLKLLKVHETSEMGKLINLELSKVHTINEEKAMCSMEPVQMEIEWLQYIAHPNPFDINYYLAGAIYHHKSKNNNQ